MAKPDKTPMSKPLQVLPQTSPVLEQQILRYQGSKRQRSGDRLVVEEPLEIRLNQHPITVTMRTPGHDDELAAGLLFSETLLRSGEDISSITHCAREDGGSHANIVNVVTVNAVDLDASKWQRNFFSSSSCGLCGKTTLESVRQQTEPVPDGPHLTRQFVATAVAEMTRLQRLFAQTGGLHSAALVDPDCGVVVAREDIGRHNAVDKVIGHAVLAGWIPLHRYALAVSGRISFEITQKALIAGIPILLAVSAASTLAVDLGRQGNMTLVGFCRDNSFNVYCGWERID